MYDNPSFLELGRRSGHHVAGKRYGVNAGVGDLYVTAPQCVDALR
jgi:hypothetical protein